HRVRRAVEHLDADAVRKRAERAREERTLYLKDEPDGMATVCAYLPAEQAHAVFDAITDHVLTARATLANTGTADPPPGGAHRADELVDQLAAALGLDLRHPLTPAPAAVSAERIAELNRGAEAYTPSRALKNAIRARDKHCRFPGCRRPAIHCDIDHTVAF